MKVLIFGASGLTGQQLVSLLTQDKNIDEIHLALRGSSTPLVDEHHKVIPHQIDFSDTESINKILITSQASHVFCTLGTTIKKAGSQQAFKAIDVTLISLIGERAFQSQFTQVFSVISALGAQKKSRVFYNRCKGETEQNLINQLKKANQNSTQDKQLIISRPSLLIGARNEFRFGEHLAMLISRCLPFLFKGRGAIYQPIHAKMLANAMFKASIINHANAVTIIENDQLHRLANNAETTEL